MKTSLPKNELSGRRQNRRALTILEMLVSAALLSFIVLGLTAMFIQTQRAFKTGIKQATITDAGRTIMDMIADDMTQMSDPRFTNNFYPFIGTTISAPNPPNLSWATVTGSELINYTDNGQKFRTNLLQDIFAVVHTNATWMGIGYTVSNWFTNANGGTFPGVGTLYRYFYMTNGPLATNNILFARFTNELNLGTFNSGYFHRIADGVVHLKMTAYDADGNEMYYEPYYDLNGTTYGQGLPMLQYPHVRPTPTNTLIYVTNYLPHSVDIELGILEPEAFEKARSLFAAGGTVAASNYLAKATGQIEIFRQHIIIPAAP